MPLAPVISLPPAKATLEDVARTAGVHRSTVSLSLRDHPRIPEATRRRVKAAALQLGYRIDPLVSALMQTRRSAHASSQLRLAYLSVEPRSGGSPAPVPDYYPGAAQRARDFGFQLERYAWRDSVSSRQLSDRLSVRCIKGLLVDTTAAGMPWLDLEWNRFSCVALGTPSLPLALHHVTENDFDAVCQAMERCRERGYRRVGYVQASALARTHLADRALGAYTMQQLRYAPHPRLPVCPGQPATLRAFQEWLAAHQPDALLVDDPPVVDAWLQRSGRRVPRDIGLVGLQLHCSSPCTGFYCDPAATGALAVEMLLGLMHRKETGIPATAHEILLTGEWREQGTLPVRVRSTSVAGDEHR